MTEKIETAAAAEPNFGAHEPASLVHAAYPHTGVRHDLTPSALGAQCSRITIQFLDELAALPPLEGR